MTADLTTLTAGESSNSTVIDLTENVFGHDEFFQDKEEVPVSESYICKKILYSTIGVSHVKAFDVCLLVPALLFLLCLVYTSPRSRQKLSGAPTLVVALQFITLISSVVCLLRSLLLVAIPTVKDSNNALDKVSWTMTRSTLLCLEITAVLNVVFPTLPNTRNSRRLLAGTLLFSILFFVVTLAIELGVPSAAFHLFELGYYLYGEGGGLYTALVAGILGFLHFLVLFIRMRQHKSSPGRSSAIKFSVVFLVINSIRALGGLILLTGLEGGICLTSITLFVHTVVTGPLVFVFLLSPFLRHGQGHSLLAYTPQLNDWEEEDESMKEKLGDTATILKNESSDPELQENEDDYQI